MAREFSVVGKPIPRVDAPEKASGRAVYSIDDCVPGMLYGKILTSLHAHANIKEIDTSKAEALPGVRAVLTYKDVLTFALKELKVLDSKARYVGDEVAAVAADTEEIADRALKLIDVDYEVLPAVFDPEEALKPEAPELYPELVPGNLIYGMSRTKEKGDVEQGFTESDTIYEDVLTTFPQPVIPLGRLCAIAWWEGDRLTEIDSTQVPYQVRAKLASWLDMPLNKVRVIYKFMGGGMGEDNCYRYTGIAAYLAKKAKKPVKVITDPMYHFAGSAKKRANSKIYLKVGVKNDGSIMAISARMIWDKGADRSGGPGYAQLAALEYYECPNYFDESVGVLTNTPPNGAHRGYGFPEVIWAQEVMMDRIANDLGIDPLEFRLQQMQAGRSKRPLEIAAERIGWKDKWTPPASKTGTKRRGIGIATVIGWSSGYSHYRGSSATIQLLDDGKFYLEAGISDTGTGSKTTMTQVAAEALSVNFEDVTIASGDTILPPDVGSQASRVAVTAGTAVYNAAQDLKSKLFKIVAAKLEVKPEDLDVEDGKIFVKASPDIYMTYKEVAAMRWTEGYQAGWGTQVAGELIDLNPISAQVAEVEVDTETGEVQLIALSDVYDIGTALNPAIVLGQLSGGVACGLGYGITEDIIYDPITGAVLNSSYLMYKLPTMVDIPTLDLALYEDEPNPCTPYGQRGVGEPSVCAAAPAINNAVYNAIGVSCDGNPITPQKILNLLGKVS